MKRLMKMSMCFLLMLGVCGIQGVQAEGISTYTGDAEDNVFSEFNEENIIVRNYYLQQIEYHKDGSPEFNSAYNDYKNYLVLYQQGTGINTLEDLYFEFIINDKTVSNIK